MSFNWTQLIPGVGHEHAHVATLVGVTGVVVALGLRARATLGTGEVAVVPAGKFSVRGVTEMITESIGGLSEQVIGHEGRRYAPYFSAVFIFILLNNLVGIIPGMTPATENFNTTFAFGICSFLSYNFIGLKKGGFHYLQHFLGPVLWLAPLMLIIELISHALRPLTLGLRLANVMTGDHTVLTVFLGLMPVVVPLPFYILGLLVCLIQAFVFTLLSMVYVALAYSEEEH